MKVISLPTIPDDWKAEWLVEMHSTRQNPDRSNSVHRVQQISVVRDGVQYKEETDLGDASRYPHEETFIWAGGLTPVGRVREIAAHQRGEKTFVEMQGIETPDIPRLYREYAEEVWKQAKHQTTIGPALIRQRS